jgi:hypothetical protein
MRQSTNAQKQAEQRQKEKDEAALKKLHAELQSMRNDRQKLVRQTATNILSSLVFIDRFFSIFI